MDRLTSSYEDALRNWASIAADPALRILLAEIDALRAEGRELRAQIKALLGESHE